MICLVYKIFFDCMKHRCKHFCGILFQIEDCKIRKLGSHRLFMNGKNEEDEILHAAIQYIWIAPAKVLHRQ